MVCADTNSFVLTIVCLINIAIAIFFFLPFSCKPCHAIHDFIGSKVFAILALDLSLFMGALIYTVAPSSWPSGVTAQLWIIVSFWIFFYFIFDVLWVIIFPLSAMSLMSPIWVVIQDVIRAKWKYAFGVDASDALVVGTFVTMLLLLSVMTILLFYYKFLHRIYYSIVLSVLLCMAFKVLIFNVPVGRICCEFNEATNQEECPILFSLAYLIIMVIVMLCGVTITMSKYEMLCCTRNIQTKAATRKQLASAQSTVHTTMTASTCQMYNRLDKEDSTETTNLLSGYPT
jgi:hypothetical protein